MTKRHQGGTRELGTHHLDSLGGTREAPGGRERINWTACKHQGGRKEPFAPPERYQGSTRETRRTIADRIPVLEGRRILYNF